MRMPSSLTVAVALACAALGACRGTDPVHDLSPHEWRQLALDSLARHHPCARIAAKLLYDEQIWTRRQACAVAGRALDVLGRAEPIRGFMAPEDTARVATIAVWRFRGCMLQLVNDSVSTGRVEPLLYVVEMDVPDRPRYLGVVLDSRSFTGDAAPDAHSRGWGGPPYLTARTDMVHPREEGSPCGYDDTGR
jgi:hypothetical protein